MLLKIFLVVGTFFLMEGVAWFTHKYIMHGFMWTWHRSHHVHHNEPLERNDLFAVVFATVSITTFALGTYADGFWFLFWIGLGVACYGIFYFIFHDVIVHRRIKIKFIAKHPYMKRIMKAHYIHHKVHTREGAEAFGFLYAPKKYE
jgi:beta-carotene 3-hydroxylase